MLSGSRLRTACSPALKARDDLRPVAGQRLRHVLVGGALARPFGIELRIGLIGLGQRLGEGFGPGRGGGKTDRGGSGKTDASCHAKTNARSKHAPCHVASSSGTPNHVNPKQPRPSAPADDPDTFTCLEGAAATSKPGNA